MQRARDRVGNSPIGSSPAKGEWVRSDGTIVPIRSGTVDDYYQRVNEFVAANLPPARRKVARLASHMEVKVAIKMRNRGLTEETVVVDRSVCGTRDFDSSAPLTCDKQLETTFLAPGSILHVAQPDGSTITDTGREEHA
ncbi:DddA-like double-stranded DNA deaminase toxin [Amycolatopsis sp. DSM 110486]|uniref:DddA-like double-stranded DNA deaminase toxin n=1 Tax=Amycolatopsis sp. DSM 110486 TaxID=2865832 RepID=UPI001C6A3B46|nr:DddA-like double-stranded DNA deaminase toxin [Amycolatopsis sp. DSM 110486]QYN25675.1 hypothetical protein K1T34_26585 [Amycolatopsis sp. DSM 110486]